MKKFHSAEYKAKLVIEALRETKTTNQIASENEINPSLLTRWKTEAINGLAQVFRQGTTMQEKERAEYEEKIDELYKQIGRLTTELEWVKKKSMR